MNPDIGTEVDIVFNKDLVADVNTLAQLHVGSDGGPFADGDVQWSLLGIQFQNLLIGENTKLLL